MTEKTVLQEVADLEHALANTTMKEAVITIARLLATRIDELASRVERTEEYQEELAVSADAVARRLMDEFGLP